MIWASLWMAFAIVVLIASVVTGTWTAGVATIQMGCIIMSRLAVIESKMRR